MSTIFIEAEPIFLWPLLKVIFQNPGGNDRPAVASPNLFGVIPRKNLKVFAFFTFPLM